MIYLNPRLSYYYFGLRKTNARHIGILLPVLNLITHVTSYAALYNTTKFR